MLLYHIIILALVQGVTEFLPISSSGHLLIVHDLTQDSVSGDHWGEELTMDIAVHVGTLFSVLLYFRKDIFSVVSGVFAAARDRKGSQGLSLGINVLAASLPVIAAGLILQIYEPYFLRNMAIVGWTTLAFGVLLWAADRYFPDAGRLEKMPLRHALLVGLCQAVALIPGVSRSGITMTAGRALGYGRTESARFSLLLAIVAISGAGLVQGVELAHARNLDLGMDVLLAAFLAFLAGWAAIALMMRWLARATFTPFAVYRVALGVLLIYLYSL